MNQVISREYVEKNYIHKDKIREVIEELDKLIEESKKRNNGYWTDYSIILDKQKEILLKILEETEDVNK